MRIYDRDILLPLPLVGLRKLARLAGTAFNRVASPLSREGPIHPAHSSSTRRVTCFISGPRWAFPFVPACSVISAGLSFLDS